MKPHNLAGGERDSCITQLMAQGPSRTCNESKEELSLAGGERVPAQGIRAAHPRGRGGRPRAERPPGQPNAFSKVNSSTAFSALLSESGRCVVQSVDGLRIADPRPSFEHPQASIILSSMQFHADLSLVS